MSLKQPELRHEISDSEAGIGSNVQSTEVLKDGSTEITKDIEDRYEREYGENIEEVQKVLEALGIGLKADKKVDQRLPALIEELKKHYEFHRAGLDLRGEATTAGPLNKEILKGSHLTEFLNRIVDGFEEVKEAKVALVGSKSEEEIRQRQEKFLKISSGKREKLWEVIEDLVNDPRAIRCFRDLLAEKETKQVE